MQGDMASCATLNTCVIGSPSQSYSINGGIDGDNGVSPGSMKDTFKKGQVSRNKKFPLCRKCQLYWKKDDKILQLCILAMLIREIIVFHDGNTA